MVRVTKASGATRILPAVKEITLDQEDKAFNVEMRPGIDIVKLWRLTRGFRYSGKESVFFKASEGRNAPLNRLLREIGGYYEKALGRADITPKVLETTGGEMHKRRPDLELTKCFVPSGSSKIVLNLNLLHTFEKRDMAHEYAHTIHNRADYWDHFLKARGWAGGDVSESLRNEYSILCEGCAEFYQAAFMTKDESDKQKRKEKVVDAVSKLSFQQEVMNMALALEDLFAKPFDGSLIATAVRRTEGIDISPLPKDQKKYQIGAMASFVLFAHNDFDVDKTLRVMLDPAKALTILDSDIGARKAAAGLLRDMLKRREEMLRAGDWLNFD